MLLRPADAGSQCTCDDFGNDFDDDISDALLSATQPGNSLLQPRHLQDDPATGSPHTQTSLTSSFFTGPATDTRSTPSRHPSFVSYEAASTPADAALLSASESFAVSISPGQARANFTFQCAQLTCGLTPPNIHTSRLRSTMIILTPLETPMMRQYKVTQSSLASFLFLFYFRSREQRAAQTGMEWTPEDQVLARRHRSSHHLHSFAFCFGGDNGPATLHTHPMQSTSAISCRYLVQ